MFAIDKIFEVLCNGNWHRLVDVAERTGANESKIDLISSFLSAYDFLDYEKKTKMIRLSTAMQDFIEKIREVEQKEDTGKNKCPS